ncbi:hypothetical protein HFN16_03910 [Pseudodesulfovibrio sp. zrk46]|nr:hypothetical protein HFN16_03910 [Pseudodesulfovibrio sp. zrk46]
MLDMEIWIGLIALTALLYLIKFIQGRSKRTVYRISSESLQRSKQVMLKVLPLVENVETDSELLDDRRLPFPKDNIKSAAKILAYYYWKQDQQTELARVKNVFISLSRFQDVDLGLEDQARRLSSEKKRLTREFEYYITHSPFSTGRGFKCTQPRT